MSEILGLDDLLLALRFIRQGYHFDGHEAGLKSQCFIDKVAHLCIEASMDPSHPLRPRSREIRTTLARFRLYSLPLLTRAFTLYGALVGQAPDRSGLHPDHRRERQSCQPRFIPEESLSWGFIFSTYIRQDLSRT